MRIPPDASHAHYANVAYTVRLCIPDSNVLQQRYVAVHGNLSHLIAALLGTKKSSKGPDNKVVMLCKEVYMAGLQGSRDCEPQADLMPAQLMCRVSGISDDKASWSQETARQSAVVMGLLSC